MLKISLVTPNYNYGHFLEATLRSVLDQGYPELEYIALDDGSTDGSIGILEKHESQLSKWETGPNRGQYRVLTDGLNRSTGEVMGWLNSDDMHFPWTLRAVGEIFKAFPNIEWISSLQPFLWDYHGFGYNFSRLDGFSKEAFLEGRFFPNNIPRPAEIQPGLPMQGTIQQESTFWRRSLWEKAGGYVSHEYGSAGDFELWARFYRHAELYGVDIPLAGFRLQHQQQSAQAEKYGRFALAALCESRRESGWVENVRRRKFFANKNRFYKRWLYKFRPTMLERAMEKFLYHGKSIVRKNPASPNSGWEVRHFRFS